MRVGPGTDVVDVAVLMSDYNLITVPVVDEDRRMIGLITVDDVLEATLPEDWRRRRPPSRRTRTTGSAAGERAPGEAPQDQAPRVRRHRPPRPRGRWHGRAAAAGWARRAPRCGRAGCRARYGWQGRGWGRDG